MAEPSITYWNRIEPSPRADSLVRGLEAAVRDPLWFLARQWQLGELQGEDAASPAYVTFAARTSRFAAWRVGKGPERPLDNTAPLEALIETEPSTPDWRIAVELGQMLERRLVAAGASAAAVQAFRTSYPVPKPYELSLEDQRDAALVRFLRICGGRGIEGRAARAAAQDAAPNVPPEVPINAGDTAPVVDALGAFLAGAQAAPGAVGRADAPGWRPDRLDYDVQVSAETPLGALARMRAYAGPFGAFDWYAFDEIGRDRPEGEPELQRLNVSLFPTSVDFAGMPNARWWQFEDARFNWTNIDADRRELAKAMVLDFMLVQGNDWFLVPFGQPVGSLLRVDQLLVRDVFGELTLVRRADHEAPRGRARWTMFSTAVAGEGGERLADYFILPPTALRTTLDGPDLEEVRFFRDEQANMVWAVEAKTENGIGRAWVGRERAQTVPDETPPPPATDAPLRYRLQTTVPVNWIPFVPVQIDAARRAVALERAAMQRFAGGAPVDVAPVGRVLNPTNLADPAVYRVREEEVSRAGARILRAVRRTRWLDGSTHLWISRRARAGHGEGSSGLRFDLAIRTRASEGQR